MLVSEAAPANDFESIREDIENMVDADFEKRDDGTSMAPTLVRLAWHCSGTYSCADKTGGSNGCQMRFNPEAGWGANAGLSTARLFLEPLKKKYPGVSFADLYTFAGVVAIESMGGPTIPWSPGRIDHNDGTKSPPDGRLPNADMGSPVATAQHLRDIFNRMGFNDQEIVALSGAHALGRCHEDASGYWGPWSFSETTLSNEYFRLLKEEKWTPKKTHNGQPWKGPDQFEDPTGSLMMLPSDIVLTQDAEFDKYVTAYAADEDLFMKDFAAVFGKLLSLGCTQAKCPAAGPVGFMGKLKGMLGL